jgi:hypothetical protein
MDKKNVQIPILERKVQKSPFQNLLETIMLSNGRNHVKKIVTVNFGSFGSKNVHGAALFVRSTK